MSRINKEIALGHLQRYARGPATFCESKVRDCGHGRVTSRHGLEYASWLLKVQGENIVKQGAKR
jgi:hypothetical protein